jgi:uncharacterized protein (TIGR03083 family)
MSDAVLNKLTRARARLLDIVDGLPDSVLDRGPAGQWTIRQMVTHVLNSEEDHCRVIAVVAEGEADRLPVDFDRDKHNESRVNERGHLSREELVAALVAQRKRTEALYDRLSEMELDMIAPHPALGEMALRDIFRIIGIHDQMHTREIAAYLRDNPA